MLSRREVLALRPSRALAVLIVAAAAPNTHASYHFMQIEQVIAGVNGDPQAQAIQLRMRSNSQNYVSRARLIARDANGENPVVLIDISTDLPLGTTGQRVLLASEKLSSYTTPSVQADFVLTALIPEAYLASGSLTFENDEGTLLVWRLSWGGAAYTGPTGGALTNDDDGEFGPPYPDPLPNSTLQALLFDGPADAKGTTNAADYSLTDGAAVLTNNAGATFTVTELQCPNHPDGDVDGDHICGDVDNCPDLANGDQSDSDDDGFGDACDECPNDAAKTEPGICGCGRDDEDDDDADGVIDCIDNCPGLSNAAQSDRDEDGAGDACDDCPDDADITHAGAGGCAGEPDDNANTNGNDNAATDNDNTPDDGDPAGNDNVGTDDGPSDPNDTAGSGSQPRGCGVALIPFLFGCTFVSLRRLRRHPVKI